MLEFEVASIYYMINEILGIQSYFDEVPQGMTIPNIFYPTPNFEVGNHSMSANATVFTMTARIMDFNSLSASSKASEVLQTIAGARYKVPIVDDTGKLTGKHFRLDAIKAVNVEEGIYDILLSWRRFSAFTEQTAVLAKKFYFNGTMQ